MTAVIVAGLVMWLRSGDQGTIMPLSPAESASLVPAYKTFSDRYMTFQYKGDYSLQNLPAQGKDIEVYMLKADTQYQKQIAVSVSQAANGYQSDSAYLLRQSQPNIYQSQPVTVAGTTGVVWTKNDGTEETVMLPHDGDIVTLSFTAAAHGYDPTGLNPEVRALLATFQWRQ